MARSVGGVTHRRCRGLHFCELRVSEWRERLGLVETVVSVAERRAGAAWGPRYSTAKTRSRDLAEKSARYGRSQDGLGFSARRKSWGQSMGAVGPAGRAGDRHTAITLLGRRAGCGRRGPARGRLARRGPVVGWEKSGGTGQVRICVARSMGAAEAAVRAQWGQTSGGHQKMRSREPGELAGCQRGRHSEGACWWYHRSMGAAAGVAGAHGRRKRNGGNTFAGAGGGSGAGAVQRHRERHKRGQIEWGTGARDFSGPGAGARAANANALAQKRPSCAGRAPNRRRRVAHG